MQNPIHDLTYETMKLQHEEWLQQAEQRRLAKLVIAGKPTFVERIASKVAGVFASRAKDKVQESSAQAQPILTTAEDAA